MLDCRDALKDPRPEDRVAEAHSRSFVATAVGGLRDDLRLCCTERPVLNSPGPLEGLTDRANFALHVDDGPNAVQRRREALAAELGCGPIQWLDQRHTVRVLDDEELEPGLQPVADGALVARPGLAAALLTADCLPVVLWADLPGAPFAVLHAGWQGLLGGILEAGVEMLRRRVGGDVALCAWLGPHVCAAHYEVDRWLAERFANTEGMTGGVPMTRSPRAGDKVQLSLAGLALAKLSAFGIRAAVASECSYGSARYYSHRRAQQLGLSVTGRFATLAWQVS